jgi:hypothetical protein
LGRRVYDAGFRRSRPAEGAAGRSRVRARAAQASGHPRPDARRPPPRRRPSALVLHPSRLQPSTRPFSVVPVIPSPTSQLSAAATLMRRKQPRFLLSSAPPRTAPGTWKKGRVPVRRRALPDRPGWFGTSSAERSAVPPAATPVVLP